MDHRYYVHLGEQQMDIFSCRHGSLFSHDRRMAADTTMTEVLVTEALSVAFGRRGFMMDSFSIPTVASNTEHRDIPTLLGQKVAS